MPVFHSVSFRRLRRICFHSYTTAAHHDEVSLGRYVPRSLPAARGSCRLPVVFRWRRPSLDVRFSRAGVEVVIVYEDDRRLRRIRFDRLRVRLPGSAERRQRRRFDEVSDRLPYLARLEAYLFPFSTGFRLLTTTTHHFSEILPSSRFRKVLVETSTANRSPTRSSLALRET